MGNGAPGDHWYSDVVVHGVPTLSAEADRLVIAIRDLAGEHGSSEPVTSLVDGHLARARQRRSRSGGSTAFIERHLEPAEIEALERDLRAMFSERSRS